MVDREALSRGEARAIEQFYRENARTVLRWVIRLGGRDVDAEDTAQDVFATAMRRIRSFRPDGSPEAWLYGVARRVVANARRRGRLRRFLGLQDVPPVPSSGPSAEAHVEQLWRRRLVQEILDELSDTQREVLVLVDLDDRPAAEAAAMIGIPIGTVYSRLHHARRQFAAGLARHRPTLEPGLSYAQLVGEDR